MSARRVRAASVAVAIRRDLGELEARAPGISQTGEAQALIALGKDMDRKGDAVPVSARVRAAKEIRDGMAALRSRLPEAPARDRLDEVAERRAARVARS